MILRLLAVGDAGIVDQDVEAAEAFGGFFAERPARRLVLHVGFDRDRAAAVRLDPPHRIGIGFGRASRHDHGGSSACERARNAKADAAVAAGNDGDAAGEIELIHGFLADQ